MNDNELVVHEEATFRIIGDHPHAGELCHPVGYEVGKIIVMNFYGGNLYQVKLIDCPHLVSGCFVKIENLEPIK